MANLPGTVEAVVVNAAQQIEKQIDDEIDRLNNLQDDDLEAIRRRRLAQMKQDAENRALWLRNGHGKLQHITEKDFFDRAKGVQRMVVIFHRKGSSRYSQDIIDHIARVAEKHLETLFATIDAEKSPFLCSKLKIRMLPSLVLCKDSEIANVLHGLDQISPSGRFSNIGIEKRLFEMEMVTDTNIADDS